MKSLENESVLIQEMQAGNQEAFATLYRFYSPRLYMNILRMVRDPLTTEEMVQELFTRIWHKRESKGIKENFAGYLYRTGQHLVHDFFRKLQKDKQLQERFRSQLKETYQHVEEIVELHQSTAILQKAIKQLSPQQKKVYELVKMEGCSYKKAAEILGISPLTVKEYLVTTKKTIRNYLKSQMDNSPELMFFMLLFNTYIII